jgi:hypothetical protein
MNAEISVLPFANPKDLQLSLFMVHDCATPTGLQNRISSPTLTYAGWLGGGVYRSLVTLVSRDPRLRNLHVPNASISGLPSIHGTKMLQHLLQINLILQPY